jgi:hypothetical protein
MGCNCGKGNLAAPPPGEEFVVVGKDGQETTGYESKVQAMVAAAKLGGVVVTRPAK